MIKIDRTTALGVSGILVIISMCLTNTVLLLLSLLAFAVLAFYNMCKNTQENKLFDYNSLSKVKRLFCETVFGIAIIGIAWALMGLFWLS